MTWARRRRGWGTPSRLSPLMSTGSLTWLAFLLLDNGLWSGSPWVWEHSTSLRQGFPGWESKERWLKSIQLEKIEKYVAGVQSGVQACCSARCVQGPHPVPPGVSLPHDRFRLAEDNELKLNVVRRETGGWGGHPNVHTKHKWRWREWGWG